jgi:hypothetical protein
MGLRQGDLKDLVYDIFEIDSYKSKMGADKDIVTISFSVKEKEPAEDLMHFLETGYNFVLDADVTAGEQSDGTYRVFVELERNKDVSKHISEIINGMYNLTGNESFKFRYYKNFRSQPATEEALAEVIPTDPDTYGLVVTEANLENYKNFFSNSYIESVDMLENTLIVNKRYAEPLIFEFVDFGETLPTIEKIKENIDIMNSYPEILYLTKYLGDYNISKYGNKLVFENQNKALVLIKRNI